MSLVDHAKRELALLDNDEDFNNAIIKSVEAFASYGHSGGSASYAIPLLNDLLQFKNISPLTDDPDEWTHIYDGDPMAAPPEPGVWQSRRNSEAFSNDGGKTYYLLSEREPETMKNGPIHRSKHKNEEENKDVS